MKHQTRIVASVVAFLLLTIPVPIHAENARNAERPATKPNIVIMLVDDMGIMDTSLPFLTDGAGKPKRYPLNDFYRSPNMERLAQRGIRFNDFNAMSVCSPTRISMMTGQNAARHRTTNWISPDNNNGGPNGPPDWNWQGLKKGDVTLPRLLQGQGYRTIHVGKGHFAPRKFEGADPRNLGFDINVGGASIGAPASYYGMQNYGNEGGSVKKQSPAAVPGLEKYHGTDTFLTDALTLEAKAHVSDAVKANKPFFLYLAHYAVHAPFNSDPRFAANYKNSGKPANAQAFASLVEGMDKSLGNLLDHLEKLGIAENTIIFFLGDNGTDAPLGHQHDVACAAPLRGKKGSHYEGGVRVPFIAAWVKANVDNPTQKRFPIAAGAIQPQQASVQDLFPTILNLTETDIPRGHIVDGQNLKTLLAGNADSHRSQTFLMHYPHAPHRSDYWTSYRAGDWKVIYHYFPGEASGKSHYQLFNLKTDPFEQTDLAARNPDDLRRMMRGLIAALEEHHALYPVDKDRQPLKPKLP
jgi:arylsulfatase A-like enzyme